MNILSLGLLFMFASKVGAVDYLANAKQDVADNFGDGSSIIWYFYLAEIITSLFAYIKTKNPLIFVGVIVVVLVTRVCFMVVGS